MFSGFAWLFSIIGLTTSQIALGGGVLGFMLLLEALDQTPKYSGTITKNYNVSLNLILPSLSFNQVAILPQPKEETILIGDSTSISYLPKSNIKYIESGKTELFEVNHYEREKVRV
jgi:hypothetical protein